MIPTNARKAFDCVAFKRKAQMEVYEEIKGMTPRQQIEYFTRQAEKGPLGKWWRKVKSTPRNVR